MVPTKVFTTLHVCRSSGSELKQSAKFADLLSSSDKCVKKAEAEDDYQNSLAARRKWICSLFCDAEVDFAAVDFFAVPIHQLLSCLDIICDWLLCKHMLSC